MSGRQKLTHERGERILFVDDEPALVRISVKTVEGFGYRVTAHTDAQQALEAFRDRPNAFDLTVTDQTMHHAVAHR